MKGAFSFDDLASANRYKKRDMKVIEAELSEIKKKKCSPMAVENLFEDSPIYCFSNHPEIAQPSRDCLCYYAFLRGCC